MIKNGWEMVIGIEIHLELNTKTKMFSPALNSFGDKENTNVSFIDLAYPGTLPLVNKNAIIKAIKLAKALKMEINKIVRFDRKNYFYPDLTKGYQITQQFNPIGTDGTIKIKVDNNWKEIAIERIHMEEDTAKSIHDNKLTYLNYNRSGVPLIEIVSRPVITSGKEACAYVDAIRQTALALNISDAKLNEGSLRTDVNISVKKIGEKELRTRCEIKNLNSLANIAKAIDYEANLQIEKYEKNEPVIQCTKRFDEDKLQTSVMRLKSDAIDYKYFPDPNLPYIELTDELIKSVEIEELPFEREQRYVKNNLNNVQISQLLNNLEYATYLDKIPYKDFKKSANLFFSDLVAYLNENKLSIQDLKIKEDEFAILISYVQDSKINKQNVQKIIDLKQKNSEKSIDKLIKENNLFVEVKVFSSKEIVDSIFKENATIEQEADKNFDKTLKFILGQAMKKTMGKANVKEIETLAKERLKK
ncbi:aspartyl/glutamyl-tRNA(Asn/Gln) amidotransferase subunit B [Metamycoplasma subdolum]|uniref:Aspartyl/glutamyl-tRNA(Asn/Gln) amidotransferase subunit B n=1 Tax=Metamycoplasma subdolum TaxID=92407 RepID=A0A3L9ZX81_9BACT|nr:Asp-tRNA(Asn)/Glu-tRNA(Gln) amidotransferase subunit GatB [Metamycoplasma subdolum]RMA77481.1 aspartyl/glutamyl-tRNA(Asn/Gln) amidotransferase subunit B [Metamycoplasma subdolum]WPB50680.1 Asp-tRNA(Asn)/Glu-tRNA(Gln) amidotransferase subunit GatB [Metamycoplasma subdolum]